MIHKRMVEIAGQPMARITFLLHGPPEAQTIQLVGRLDDDQEILRSFTRNAHGQWSLTLDSPVGQVLEFRYLCDGRQWLDELSADAHVHLAQNHDHFFVVTDPPL